MMKRSLLVMRRVAQRNQQRRALSVGNPADASPPGELNKYLYPSAKEAPMITRTTAKEATSSSAATISQQEESNSKVMARDPDDRFDDSQTLSDLEKQARKDMQNKFLSTALESSTRITKEVPSYIPRNNFNTFDKDQAPQTQITTLDNGLRVVSQETFGQVCAIGILGDFGSRHEPQVGVAHLTELMSFSGFRQVTNGSNIEYESSVHVQEQLQDWGASSFANSGREQTLWCLDILRPNVDKGMQLMAQSILYPKLGEEEVDHAKQIMNFQATDLPPDLKLGEAMLEAAYGKDQQLGKPHFAPEEAIPSLSGESVHDFLETQFYHNPQNVVVAAAGIGHDELVDMSQYHFGHLAKSTETTTTPTIPSVYRGGLAKAHADPEDGMTRIAVALEIGGWHSDILVPACVLQTLLGGGSSFSAGGPGKGMYSRLYRQVLNRWGFVDSAEAQTIFHGESGLFGIAGSAKPARIRDVARILSDHLLQLATKEVQDEEIERARNMLKNNVLSQLESRLVLFEDMGRQVLTYGHREDAAAMTAKIDAVTKEDIQSLIKEAIKKPPTLALVGDDSSLPEYDEVKSWLST